MAHLESLRFHFNLTLASLKTPANHMENEATEANGTGDQRHQGNQRNSKIHRKTKDGLSIPLRTHAGITREAPSSRRTAFYLISQNKVEHQTHSARARHRTRTTNDNKKPSDRITHPGTIKISRFDSPPNLRYRCHMYICCMHSSVCSDLTNCSFASLCFASHA